MAGKNISGGGKTKPKTQYYSQAGAMAKPKEVTVKKGDTMWGITKRESGTKSNAATAKKTAQNAKTSGLKNPNLIKPGQKVKVERAYTTGKNKPSANSKSSNYSPGAVAIQRTRQAEGRAKNKATGRSGSGAYAVKK